MYLKNYNLKNKTAVVTGAGKGLGRACAIALAEAGARKVEVEAMHEPDDAVAAVLQELKWHYYLY